ncbi:hypothetical protein [Treponema sp.]|uniref:hypothetical protein n=1 Tax=Treponema sp. TaxID=166 RepID=UPI003890BFE0
MNQILKEGKTTATGAILQHWNEDHPNEQINAVLTSALTNEQVVAAMKNGTYDAFFTNIPSFNQIQKEYGEIFRLVEEPISTSPAYFIFNLDNPELKKDVDGALKQLIDSGELAKLAVKDLGSDTTKNITVLIAKLPVTFEIVAVSFTLGFILALLIATARIRKNNLR